MDAPPSTDIALFEGFCLDRRSGALLRRDERGVYAPVAIGSRALDILRLLIERPGDLVSRAEILASVWPGTVVEDSNLNVQIAALRRVLDDGRAEGSCIQTVSGRGYRFVAPPPPLAPADKPSIAVLAFQNMSGDPEQEYFVDGMVEENITDRQNPRKPPSCKPRRGSHSIRFAAAIVSQSCLRLGVVLAGHSRSGFAPAFSRRVLVLGEERDGGFS
jgi:DNA-binding winged helix-turn-helix (wHTH) protein